MSFALQNRQNHASRAAIEHDVTRIRKRPVDADFEPVDTILAVLAAVLFAAMFALYTHYGEAGWFVLIAIYGLIASEISIRRSPGLFITISALVFIHELVAVFNLYGHTLPGADTDAKSFLVYAENRGMEDIEPAISIDLYRNFLIILVRIQGGSRALAFSSSVLAFALSLLIFNRLISLTGITRARIPILLAFGLAPHFLVYTSITLREPLQLLFFAAAVYYGVSFRTGSGIIDGVMFILCVTCLAILHQVLIPFALVLAAVILIWPVHHDSSKKTFTRVAAAVIIVSSLTATFMHVMRTEKFTGVGVVLKMAEFDADYFLRQIEGYRLAIDKDEPRTALNVDLDTSSLPALALGMPALYFNYWFAPFPWNVGETKDIVAILIALMRLGLISVIIAGFWVNRGDRRLLSLYTVLFLLMCSTWILGTTNYGQAIRHQILSDWLLLLIAGGFAERLLNHGNPWSSTKSRNRSSERTEPAPSSPSPMPGNPGEHRVP